MDNVKPVAMGLNPTILEALQKANMLTPTKKKAALTARNAAKLGLNLEDIGAVGGLLRTQEHIPYEERPDIARVANNSDIESPLEDSMEMVEEDEPRLFF